MYRGIKTYGKIYAAKLVYLYKDKNYTCLTRRSYKMVEEDEYIKGCPAKLIDFINMLPEELDTSLLSKLSVNTLKVMDIVKTFVTLRGPMMGVNVTFLSFKVLSILLLLEVKKCHKDSTLNNIVFTHCCENSTASHYLTTKEKYLFGFFDIKNHMDNKCEGVGKLDSASLQQCIDKLLEEVSKIIHPEQINSSYEKYCDMMKCQMCSSQVYSMILPDDYTKVTERSL